MSEIPIRRRDPGDALRVLTDVERLPVDAFRVSNEEIYGLLSALSDQVAQLQTSHAAILAKVTEYGDEIRPALEALSKSPIGKFLGVGK